MILSLLYAAAASQALLCVRTTGNYTQIRRYLWACLGDALATGIYVLWRGNQYGGDNLAYLAVYSATTAALLAAAWTIGWKALMFCNVDERRRTLAVSILAGAIGFLAVWRRGGLDPYNVIQLVAAAMLTAVVIQLARALPDVDEQHRLPLKTLATLWVTQAIFFYCYATGYRLFPMEWAIIGEWLPGSIMAAFLAILSFTFKPEAKRVAEQAKQGA